MDDPTEPRQIAMDRSLSTSSLDQRPALGEDPAAMTIEFLRARLLSERSVSKAARERAQQLAKKVAELERQLESEVQIRKMLEATRMDALSKYRAQLAAEYGQFFEPSLDELSYNTGEDSGAAFDRPRMVDMEGDLEQERSLNEGNESISQSSFREGEEVFSNNVMERTNSPRHRNLLDVVNGVCANENEDYGQSCKEKGVLAWGRRKGAKKQVDKDWVHGSDWFGRSSSQKSLASGDGESPQRRWAGKSVRQLRKKENSLPDTNAEEGTSQGEGHHGKGIDVERDLEVERVLERQAELIEQFEDEENAQTAWEENFREQNALSLNSAVQGTPSLGKPTESIHLMEKIPNQQTPEEEQTCLNHDSTFNAHDVPAKDNLPMLFEKLSSTLNAMDKKMDGSAPSGPPGESKLTETAEEAVSITSHVVIDDVVPELDHAITAPNIQEKDAMGSKSGKVEFSSNDQDGHELGNLENPTKTSGKLEVSCKNKVAVDDKGNEKSMEESQIRASSLGGAMNDASTSNVSSSRSQVEMRTDAHQGATQQRLRPRWGGEAVDRQSSQSSSDNLTRDFMSEEAFQRRMRAEDVSLDPKYSASRYMADLPHQSDYAQDGRYYPVFRAKAPLFPANRRAPEYSATTAYANGREGVPSMHRRSVDGGFDRVADVLQALQIAKHQVESSNEEALLFASMDAAHKSGFDGRDGFYVEPSYPPVYPTSPPLAKETHSASLSLRGPPRRSLPDSGAWGAPMTYSTDLSRQNAPYGPYSSRIGVPGSFWPPQHGYGGNFYSGDPRDQR